MKPVRVGTGKGSLELEYTTSLTPFDAIKRTKQDGSDFWSARDLMPLLGYPRWREFKAAIERASTSCQAQSHDPTLHFVGVNPNGAKNRGYEDVELSRFGAYLAAMNGDPRKQNVAMAQGYFAVKTREAELRIETPKSITPLEMIAQIAAEAVKQEQRTATLEGHINVLEAKLETIVGASGYFTVKAWAKLHHKQMPLKQAAAVGKKCAQLCRSRGLDIGDAVDEHFGLINSYPEGIITEVMQNQAQYGSSS